MKFIILKEGQPIREAVNPLLSFNILVENRNECDEIVGSVLIHLEENTLHMIQKQYEKETDDDVDFFNMLHPHVNTPSTRKILDLKFNR